MDSGCLLNWGLIFLLSFSSPAIPLSLLFHRSVRLIPGYHSSYTSSRESSKTAVTEFFFFTVLLGFMGTLYSDPCALYINRREEDKKLTPPPLPDVVFR